MTKSQRFDYGSALEPLFSSADITAMQNIWFNSSEFQNKFYKIALCSMIENIDLTKTWADETFSEIDAVIAPQSDPLGYVKGLSEFSTKQVKSTSKGLSDLAIVAQKAQMEALRLLR